MQDFDIYFLGEMLPDSDPEAVKQGVGKLFNVEGKTLDRMFSGKPMRVKQSVDADKASRYRAAFREVGALVQIVAAGATPPEPKPPTAVAAPEPEEEEIVIVAPPSSDDEEIVVTAPVPPADDEVTFVESTPQATSAMSLAAPGAIIDDHPPPAPADIDTSGLEALPANSGSLEDCVVEKPVKPIPDISHLKLVDD